MKTKFKILGFLAMSSVTIVAQNVSYDQNSIPITNGNFNVGFGQQSLFSNSTGNENTAIGHSPLFQNLSGDGNTAVGYRSMNNNTTGSYNTTIGYQSDVSTSGLSNATAVGANAVVTANNSIQLGDASVTQIFGGVGNAATIIAGGLQITGGAPANGKVLTSNASGVATWQNLPPALGSWGIMGNAGTVDGTNFIGTTDNVPLNFKVNNQKAGRIDQLQQNTLYGFKAGNAISGFSPAWGNVAIGHESLLSNNMGSGNVSIGYEAMKFNNMQGDFNCAIGFRALRANTGGYQNSAFGTDALLANTTGYHNTAIGWNSMVGNTTGYMNTAIGIAAMFFNTTGHNNAAVGRNTLQTNTTGSWNTGIGMYADVSTGGLSNASAIGASAITNATNKVVIGSTGVTVIGGYATAGWSNLSDGRFKENVRESDVAGLDFILKLRPVNYTFNMKKLDEHLMQNMPDSIKAARMKNADEYAEASKIISTGFIAQEVENTVKEMGINFDAVNAPKNNTDNYSIGYAKFVVPLVKGMQEQQKMIETQQKQIEELKAMINSIAGKASSTNSIPVSLSDKNTIVLNQNTPNPFAESTLISYNIPVDFVKAQIQFSAQDGKLIKAIDLLEKSASLKVFADDLSSGVYSYTLIVDGKVIHTKKMIKE